MKELPLDIKRTIGKYEPIEAEGLTLYPIKVENYYEFLTAKPAIDFMQQSLPVELISIPLLDAYFRIDMGLVDGVEPNGLFSSALLMLALALRLMPHGSVEEQIRRFQIVPDDTRNPRALKQIKFVLNGEEMHTITPIQFGRLRPILAAQNGIELMSDTANPELIQAERDLADNRAPNLNMDIESLVTATALISRVEESEVYDWAILKMNNRLDMARRVIDYMVCGIGESQGTEWTGGNPVPHPWFERANDKKAGVIALESFANGQGLDAVQNANQTIRT